MNKNTPFFSVIIPTHNRANLVIKTLTSILEQDYNNYEVIIVDDGSTDNTEDVLLPFLSENVWYFKIENSERGAARNYGTKKAKGVYVNWFDSDDIAFPNHLQEAYQFCENNNKPEVFHFGYNFVTESGEIIYSKNGLPHTVNEILYIGNCLSCNGIFVRTDIARENLFNEDRGMLTGEDYELWLRLASKYLFYCSNTITTTIINHENRSIYTNKKPELLINSFNKFINYTTNNKIVLNLLSKNYNYFMMKNYLILSVNLVSSGNKKVGMKFMLTGIRYHWKFISEKVFYSIIKNILIK